MAPAGSGQRPTSRPGICPYSVAIGDVSGDGRPDLVVANNGDNTVSVLLGNGTGGFGAKTDFATRGRAHLRWRSGT